MSASARLKLQTAGFSIEQVMEHRLEAKIGDMKIGMIKWMVGLLLAQTGLLLGGLKLFLH